VFVIGTAGHVDHGKSTLVQALSGINPDRLAEEQRRSMTIDLGFAWLTLPGGTDVSIVDVPGHHDFVRNMLAGVGGIDVALLVIAADEGVMPQTLEHLAILNLLRVSRGVVALTKADLVDDPDWLDLVTEEVRETLSATSLAAAHIVPVSAHTGQGLDELLGELERLVSALEPHVDTGRPRLPIDRAFTIAGFGTVVTGTLTGGRLRVGQEVELAPDGIKARVRGLQRHHDKLAEADPGTRLAVNLVGVQLDELHRGQVLTTPGWLGYSRLVDVRLETVPQCPFPIRQNLEVELFVGTYRSLGRVRLLDADELRDGQSGWAQVQVREPMAVVRGDRFVLRLPSPSETLGGGTIVDANPRRRHRRGQPDVLARLAALASGEPDQIALQLLDAGPLSMRQLIADCGLDEQSIRGAVQQLLHRGLAVLLDERQDQACVEIGDTTPLLSQSAWERYYRRIVAVLESFHAEHPLRKGMPLEECRSRARLPAGYADQLLALAVAKGHICLSGALVWLSQHQVVLSAADAERAAALLADFASSPYAPPSAAQAEEQVGAQVLQHLIEAGELVRVSGDVLFARDAYARLEALLREYVAQHGSITVAQFRDLTNASRRYALAFLEDMDRRRVTRRVGDARVLR